MFDETLSPSSKVILILDNEILSLLDKALDLLGGTSIKLSDKTFKLSFLGMTLAMPLGRDIMLDPERGNSKSLWQGV